MKKIILTLLLATLLSLSVFASDDIKIGTPIIDGIIDTMYLESYKIELDGLNDTFYTSKGADPEGAKGDSATAYYLYDDAHLYVCVKVNDDAVFSRGKAWIYKNIANLSWENDAVEARIYYEELGEAIQANQYIFQCDAKGIATTNYKGMCEGEHIASTSFTETGYVIEFSLPLSFGKKQNDKIGLSVEIDDLHEMIYGADTKMGGNKFNAYGSQHPYENMVTLGSEKASIRTTVFDDTKEHWGKNDISYVFNAELFNGMGTGFCPDVAMTRGMFVTVLGRLYEKKNGALIDYASSVSFADVDYDLWYGKYIKWANGANIVGGYENNTFLPDKPITREEMAVMLSRYAKATATEVDLSFADNEKISPWAESAISFCVKNGLLSGKENNTFAPQSNATRAEVAALLTRYMKTLTVTLK